MRAPGGARRWGWALRGPPRAGPRPAQDGRWQPRSAPAAATPAPATSPASGPRLALMYVGWAPVFRAEGACWVSPRCRTRSRCVPPLSCSGGTHRPPQSKFVNMGASPSVEVGRDRAGGEQGRARSEPSGRKDEGEGTDALECAEWGRSGSEAERGWIAGVLRRIGLSQPLWAAETLESRKAGEGPASGRVSPPLCALEPQPSALHSLVLPWRFYSAARTLQD